MIGHAQVPTTQRTFEFNLLGPSLGLGILVTPLFERLQLFTQLVADVANHRGVIKQAPTE